MACNSRSLAIVTIDVVIFRRQILIAYAKYRFAFCVNIQWGKLGYESLKIEKF